MTGHIFFLECKNQQCKFRFPLDLSMYEGSFCPRCGADLEKVTPQVSQWKPGSGLSTKAQVVGILDNIRSAQNVGSIFRTSEAAGIARLYLCGLTPSPLGNHNLSKSALGSEERVAWSAHNNTVQVVRLLKSEGYQIFALECLPEAENLFSPLQSGNPGKFALIVGNEPAGVDPGILTLANRVLYIPMAGQKTSLNVAVAFGIAVYGLLSA